MNEKVVIISPKISNSDGIGRYTISIRDALISKQITPEIITVPKDSFLSSVQEFFIKFYLRNIFDFFFTICVDILLLTKYKNYKSISSSVITGLRTDQTHFSSCHLHSLIMIGEKWKLIDPRNLYYVVQEAIQFRLCKQAIFISKQEMDQFFKYYGKRKRSCNVIYPVLSKSNFNVDHKDKIFGENLFHGSTKTLFIGYNFRMKGLDIAIDMLKNSSNIFLDIIGEDTRYSLQQKPNNVRFLGKKNFLDIKWDDYGFFIFPSHSDAYALVVQEALRNGLIPIVSSQAGASEVLKEFSYLEKCVVIQNGKMENIHDLSRKYKFSLDYFIEKISNCKTIDKLPKSQEIYNHAKFAEILLKKLLFK